MPIFSVALLFDQKCVWRLTTEEADTVYSMHPGVLKYTHVVADDGPAAVILAREKIANLHTDDKFVCAIGIWAKIAPPRPPITAEEIMEAVEKANWNWKETSRLLGVHPKTLRRWRARYGIPNKKARSVA